MTEKSERLLKEFQEKVGKRIALMEATVNGDKDAEGDASKAGLLAQLKQTRDDLKDLTESHEKFAKQLPKRSTEDTRKSDPNYDGQWNSERMAKDFGLFVLAKFHPDGDVRERCAKAFCEGGYSFRKADGKFSNKDAFVKAMSESVDTAGGYLVPDEFIATLIRHVNEYGVARRNLRKVPMGRERASIAKRTGGLTVYYPDSGKAPNASDITLGLVSLTAKKWAVLTFIDEELEEDAAIGIAELLLTEMALALAIAEDTNTFMGDGSATYGGITGVFNSANVALVTMPASKTAFADVTHDDLIRLKYAVPAWVRKLPDAGYYMSSDIAGIVERLVDTTGRPMYQQPTEGNPLRIGGKPVFETEALPDTAASGAGKSFLAFGSLFAWGILGQRRSMQLRRSTEVKFLEGQTTLMVVPRQDIQEAVGEAMAKLKTAAA